MLLFEIELRPGSPILDTFHFILLYSLDRR